MGLAQLFKRKESFVAVDIGASAIKLVELDVSGDTPTLLNVAFVQFDSEGSSASHSLKPEKIAEHLTSIFQANQISNKKIVTAVPGPSSFTKRVKFPKTDPKHLAANLEFEAPNHIPHSPDAVKLDFHIIGEDGKNKIDVLIVAVKNEVVDNLLACFGLADLDVAIVDIDYFALQNAFELNYPEHYEKTVVLIDIGARYSSINICKAGESLFAGDVSVGSKQLFEGAAAEMGVSLVEFEQLRKSGADPNKKDEINVALQSSVQNVVNELNRQLSFFWNAAGADGSIDLIMLTGGIAGAFGLTEELEKKTTIQCKIIDPFKELERSEQIDEAYLADVAPLMAVAVGLGLRELGDKIIPDFL